MASRCSNGYEEKARMGGSKVLMCVLYQENYVGKLNEKERWFKGVQ
jgi:hypothetical protein